MEVLEEYENVRIKEEEGEATPLYTVIEPRLTKADVEVLRNYRKVVMQRDINNIRAEPDISARWEMLKNQIKKRLSKSPHRDFLAKKMTGMALGYGRLGLLVDDDNLEEIMVNGINLPVYVYHRKYGMCKTNIIFPDTEEISALISQLCMVNNKATEHIVDLAAIDGNRINITAGPLPSKGPTVTIRKQRRKTFSIIELIEQGTLSLDLAAFMWMAVEGMKLTPANIIIAGSIGSGKTTTLNALCTFIPPTERVITIEDTLELNPNNIENKVQLEASRGYDMDALLRDTLRMRPDRVIIGEIRGKEAITLFNAMNIGRVGMGTLHSSSAREVASRLESAPMNVPASIIGSLDIIMVQNKFVHKDKLVRRVTEVVEVTGAIKDTVMMGQIYQWDPQIDQVVRSSEQGLKTPILFLDKLSHATKFDKAKIVKELELRQAVLAYMLRHQIRAQEDVAAFIKRFYLDLEGLIRETPDLFGRPPQPSQEPGKR